MICQLFVFGDNENWSTQRGHGDFSAKYNNLVIIAFNISLPEATVCMYYIFSDKNETCIRVELYSSGGLR